MVISRWMRCRGWQLQKRQEQENQIKVIVIRNCGTFFLRGRNLKMVPVDVRGRVNDT